MREHIMIVDGYNVIGNWPELAKLKAEDHFDVARDRLLDILAEYRSHENAKMIVVFDAMYVPGIGKSYAKWDLQVVFTKEDETADRSFPVVPYASVRATFSRKCNARNVNSTMIRPVTRRI